MLARLEKLEAVNNLLKTDLEKMTEDEIKLLIRDTMLGELVGTRDDVIAILDALDELFLEQEYLMESLAIKRENPQLKLIAEGISLQSDDLEYCGNKIITMLYWLFETDCDLEEFCEVLGLDDALAEKLLASKQDGDINPFLRLLMLLDIEAPSARVLIGLSFDKAKPLKTAILEALIRRIKKSFM